MNTIHFVDRLTHEVREEQVYGAQALRLVYGSSLFGKLLGPLILPLARHSLVSRFYGWWQRQACSQKKVRPFIDQFQVDSSEFIKPVEDFKSFNDFFVRKLKPEARPICPDDDSLIIPADGRFFFYPEIASTGNFAIKGTQFDLSSLLLDERLAKRYAKGSMVLARLCPTDYHRFHFPCDGTPSSPKFINGHLYSVNPLALRKYRDIFTQNKRCYCEIECPKLGSVLFMEIGATNVGSITQTYKPYQKVKKGDEKGFFAFGASALVLLFEPGRIQFDSDLLELRKKGLEIRCLMGQSMAKIISE